MSGVPYVGLTTIVEAGPELLSGLVARIRTIDLTIRVGLGLPLFCPDLIPAIQSGAGSSGMVLVRDGDRHGVHVQEYIRVAASTSTLENVVTDNVDATIMSPGTIPSSIRPGIPQRMKSSTGTPSIAASKAAAKAAALRAAEDKLLRRKAVSAASHCLHGVSVLLQVHKNGTLNSCNLELSALIHPPTCARTHAHVRAGSGCSLSDAYSL
jgi:hypothetical protein